MADDWAVSRIRTIPNFPKKGVMFRDITTLLADPVGFRKAVDELVQTYARQSKLHGAACRSTVKFALPAIAWTRSLSAI